MRFLLTAVAAFFILQPQMLLADSRIDLRNSAFAPTQGPTSIPIGHAKFCKEHAEECGPNTSSTNLLELTEARWQMLVEINDEMNRTILPLSDENLYQVGELWTYPTNAGDCEDIALAKRRALIEAGFDVSVLLMTVVRDSDGAGHAVLMVHTDRGDLILDNQAVLIKVWNETPYRFVKRQSQANAGEWVLIEDVRNISTTVASAHE